MGQDPKHTSNTEYLLDLFDRYFIHFFITCLHLFFIFMGLWLARYDLAFLGMVFLVISLCSFELILRYGNDTTLDR